MTSARKKKTAAFILWGAVLVWMVLLFLLSAQTADESSSLSAVPTQWLAALLRPLLEKLPEEERLALTENLTFITRKSAHFIGYTILGALSCAAFRLSGLKPLPAYCSSAAFSLLYAVSDEIHQSFVPGRSGEIRDALIDLAGALIGAGILTAIWQAVRKKRNKEDD